MKRMYQRSSPGRCEHDIPLENFDGNGVKLVQIHIAFGFHQRAAVTQVKPKLEDPAAQKSHISLP